MVLTSTHDLCFTAKKKKKKRNVYNVYPCKPQFYYVKVGFKGATFTWASSSDASRKHLRTKVTPDFHLTYSKNGGNLGSESK